MSIKFDKGLKRDEFTQRATETHPGMAHWAGEGPGGAQCRHCSHFNYKGVGANGKTKKSTCNMGTGVKFPGEAMACKHFDIAKVARRGMAR